MSVIQDLQPHIDDYPRKVKAARKKQGISLQKLSDETGVPISTINNLSVGKQAYPKLYDAAAICRVLGLSLDELFGLEHKDVDELRHVQEIHKMELENVRSKSEVRRVTDVSKERERRLISYINILSAIIAFLVLVIVGYMVFDAHILNAGLFQQGTVSIWAVMLAMFVIGAVAVLVHVFSYLRSTKRPR